MQRYNTNPDRHTVAAASSGRHMLAETCTAFGQATLNGVYALNIEAIGYTRAAIAECIELARVSMGARTLRELFAAQRRFTREQVRANADFVCTLVDTLMDIGGETAAPLAGVARRAVEGLHREKAPQVRNLWTAPFTGALIGIQQERLE